MLSELQPRQSSLRSLVPRYGGVPYTGDLRQWKSPLVADLAFAVGCRPIDVDDEQFRDAAWFEQQQMRMSGALKRLDNDPRMLEQALAGQKDWRLGAYFETLVGYGIELATGVTLLGRNLQVFRQQQTIGELDFIIARDGEPVHVEVAFKYYLRMEVNRETVCFGPSLRRLDLKVSKLAEKQLRLLQVPECRACLIERGIPIPRSSEAWLKGAVFSPQGQKRLMDGVGSVVEREWTWGTLERFSEEEVCVGRSSPNRTGSERIVPIGSDWTFRALNKHMTAHWLRSNQPVLVVKRMDDPVAREISRHFLVPGDWEARARAWMNEDYAR